MEGKNLMTAKSSIVQKESGIRAVPDPEVTEKAVRRKFTAAFKLRILKEAEACTRQGQLGALLRREGLYYSNLTLWRRQINQGLIPKKRGPLAKRPDPNVRRIVELERKNAKLTHKLKHAELIIDVQKKVADLLKGSSEETS
ncbi:MAG: transposase [Deltaproteobacteria bacterium]